MLRSLLEDVRGRNLERILNSKVRFEKLDPLK